MTPYHAHLVSKPVCISTQVISEYTSHFAVGAISFVNPLKSFTSLYSRYSLTVSLHLNIEKDFIHFFWYHITHFHLLPSAASERAPQAQDGTGLVASPKENSIGGEQFSFRAKRYSIIFITISG